MKAKLILLVSGAFLILTAALFLTRKVSAQQPTPSDDQVNAIASQLFCPVCENTPLDVCPTTACHQWRELIRQMLAEGKSPAAIKQYFVDYYGARVLSEPPVTGINWLIYIVPPAAFIAGATLLFLAFRTWRRMEKDPTAGSASSAPPSSDGTSPLTGSVSALDDQYVERIEEELKRRK
ncbi:MAG: cytochrome c-type biogenesis protein [Anaerolineales bacterium]